VNFAKFLRKTELLEEFKLPDKRGFELTEKRRKKKKLFLPPANPHYNLSMMVWNISIDSLAGWLAVLPPSSCAPAH